MKYKNTFFGLTLAYDYAETFYHGSHTFVALAHQILQVFLLLCGTGNIFLVLRGWMDLPLPVFVLILSWL